MKTNLGPRGAGGRGALRKGLPQEVSPAAVSAPERATVFIAASLLLDYPKQNFGQILDQVQTETAKLPSPLEGNFSRWLEWARRVGKTKVEQTYVNTFDEQRRCALELSYYAAGDTRLRGQALLAFSQLYAAAGYNLVSGELPDYLPAVLEMAARSGDPIVEAALASHRDGLEVLRTALYQRESPWEQIVGAVCAVLPEIDEATRARYQRLIRQGPPAELVGINDLPFPTFPEATR